MNSSNIKLAIVGPRGTGKDTVANYLVEKKGFTHISSSDLIREHIISNQLGTPTRELLQKTAMELRQKHGGDYLVRLAMEGDHPRLIISGLRALPEIETFKGLGGKVIAITAPLEIRYKWAASRGDIDSTVSFEQFQNFEEREATSTDPNAQNVKGVVSLADHFIENSGDKDHLFKQLDWLLEKQFFIK
jgi:dephospho-CoA kinase